jgi:hypothetical protein
MAPPIPGFDLRRLARLGREAVARCELDLRGVTVLTEAASGAYLVTPVLAAAAGARVLALTRSTRYGTADQIARQTHMLAKTAQVPGTIEVHTERSAALCAQADIVTNSGHVRPLNAETVASLKPTAVIPLMYESWELRAADLDLEACRRRGIVVAGTNERHPAVDVFSFLGMMAVKLLLDAGVAVYGSRILLLCDNPFRPYIERGLTGGGATVETISTWPQTFTQTCDAVLYALDPNRNPPPSTEQIRTLAAAQPDVVVAQYWGDLDRATLREVPLACWPPDAPHPGHMGILPSAIGPEPIVRLQSGGLKVGEILYRQRAAGKSPEHAAAAVVESGFGQAV